MGAVAAELASDLGDLPVRYLSSEIEPAMPSIVEARQALQREQAATISTDTRFDVIDASHIEMVSDPEPATEVVDTIERFWQDVTR